MPPSIRVTSVTQQPALKKSRMITSDQALEIIPLPFPPEPWPMSSLTWHLSELTNHVCVNSSIIVVRESIEGASLDLIWLVKFSLDHPQHFSIAGLKAHLPCQGKVHRDTVRKMIGEGITLWGKLLGPTWRQRRKQGKLRLRTKGLQR